ncbi:putative bifunctional diguanylate cyclase/phosphodiesterase [Sphingobium boeckii]|uniref:Diguanylate cyclase (GGDEF)-like protein n=1 Tax=Sphingobium boeckii TaxID=1082345 RepID=A0A7W9AKV2_9SPHN|nr:EAL domain-containing protein [Sphingobium boeckii]MBB5687525.1 diguanylate cyclase (GGDEF)-like protein [Sphingobium boeckii]
MPIALLIGTSFSFIFVMLLHLTHVQDKMEQTREIEIVQTAVRNAAEMVVHDLRDYAMWDEAVLHLVQRFDSGWADDNLGPYLGNTRGYEYVIVVDGQDRPIYAYSKGRRDRSGADPRTLIGPAFAHSLDAVRKMPASSDPIVSGFSRAGDTLYIYSVAAIVPLTSKVQLPPGRPYAMIVATEVNAAFLAGMGGESHGLGYRLLTGALPEGWHQVPLHGAGGSRVGALAWAMQKPGTALRHDILPAFLIVGIVALLAAGMILGRARRAVDALQLSETRAQHLAYHDTLTGLCNRRAMLDRLDACFGAGTPVTLLYMDLDGFKETNDVYGHGAGDELLREAAARFPMIGGDGELLARVGGDEFAMLLIDREIGVVERLADTIIEAFRAPFVVGGYGVSLGISIGVAESRGGDNDTAEKVIYRSDAAMYAAKAAGKNCWRVYDPSLDTGRDTRKRMERDLRAAIQRDEIGVVFQPIVSARDHQIVCVEALARWSHAEHGMIAPDIFIPIAEQSGLIIALGRSVLATSCSEALHWGVDVAVNLSPAQFWDRGLARTVRDVLDETGFPAHRLELEITESYLLRRPEAAREILEQLRAMGVRIALDDFGTGFASIGYLRRLSFDSIKIDKSFIAQAALRQKAADMARAIVAIGDALDLPVTAEGVETAEQAMIMRRAGCARLQGWLFGRPMPGAEMTAWLAEPHRAVG